MQFIYKNIDNETVLNGGDDIWGKKVKTGKKYYVQKIQLSIKLNLCLGHQQIKKMHL